MSRRVGRALREAQFDLDAATRITPSPEVTLTGLLPVGPELCTWVLGPDLRTWRLKYRHAACPARLAGGHK